MLEDEDGEEREREGGGDHWADKMFMGRLKRWKLCDDDRQTGLCMRGSSTLLSDPFQSAFEGGVPNMFSWNLVVKTTGHK